MFNDNAHNFGDHRAGPGGNKFKHAEPDCAPRQMPSACNDGIRCYPHIRKARNQARTLFDEQINPNEQKKTAKARTHATTNAKADREKSTKVQTLTVQDLAKA